MEGSPVPCNYSPPHNTGGGVTMSQEMISFLIISFKIIFSFIIEAVHSTVWILCTSLVSLCFYHSLATDALYSRPAQQCRCMVRQLANALL